LFTILFADDTTLQYSSENLKSLYDFTNFELSKIKLFLENKEMDRIGAGLKINYLSFWEYFLMKT